MNYELDCNLNHEAVLPCDIQPYPASVTLSQKPNRIFLTGATGFVAAHVLAELLQRTDARIYALVRAVDAAQGVERIRKNLSHYRLWQDTLTDRVVPVPGDLKLPLLGLAPGEFQSLAESVDSVYHVGSKLSYVAPYAYLRAANVGGTQETLRLATVGKAKPYHYVSSVGILLGYESSVDILPGYEKARGGQEDDPLDPAKCPEVGYLQSKYVAEAIVRIAHERGIPVTIHRIGLVVGDSRSGCSNEDDFVARILIGSIQAGYGPDITNPMDMTPGDYVARAIVYLSFQPASLGKVFHLINPLSVTWSEIMDSVIEMGYPVKKLPFQEWVEAIEEHGDPATNPLHPLLPFFHVDMARRMFGVSDAAYQAFGTTATLNALAQSGITCPSVDKELVRKFLARFVDAGRLHPAGMPAAVS
jgi:thioester reductase-like protein